MLSPSIQREENNEGEVIIFLLMSSCRQKRQWAQNKILKISCKGKKKLTFNYDGDQTVKQAA